MYKGYLFTKKELESMLAGNEIALRNAEDETIYFAMSQQKKQLLNFRVAVSYRAYGKIKKQYKNIDVKAENAKEAANTAKNILYKKHTIISLEVHHIAELQKN